MRQFLAKSTFDALLQNPQLIEVFGQRRVGWGDEVDDQAADQGKAPTQLDANQERRPSPSEKIAGRRVLMDVEQSRDHLGRLNSTACLFAQGIRHQGLEAVR